MGGAKELIQSISEQVSQEDTFTVKLRGGLQITFKYPSNSSEYMRIARDAEKFSKTALLRPAPAWKPFVAGMEQDIAKACYWIFKTAVNPPFTQIEALELASLPVAVVPFIWSQMQEHIARRVADLEQEELESLGEELNETSSGETS